MGKRGIDRPFFGVELVDARSGLRWCLGGFLDGVSPKVGDVALDRW